MAASWAIVTWDCFASPSTSGVKLDVSMVPTAAEYSVTHARVNSDSWEESSWSNGLYNVSQYFSKTWE
jgi:hypothetical protein